MREAARKLKIDTSTLSKYISSWQGNPPGLSLWMLAEQRVFMWTEKDIKKGARGSAEDRQW